MTRAMISPILQLIWYVNTRVRTLDGGKCIGQQLASSSLCCNWSSSLKRKREWKEHPSQWKGNAINYKRKKKKYFIEKSMKVVMEVRKYVGIFLTCNILSLAELVIERAEEFC